MPGTFLGTHRALLVAKLALVAGMEVVKGGDVLSGWVARQPVKRRNRLSRSPDSLPCNPLELVVKSHPTRGSHESAGVKRPVWRPRGSRTGTRSVGRHSARPGNPTVRPCLFRFPEADEALLFLIPELQPDGMERISE